MSELLLPQEPIERLAKQSPPEVTLSPDELFRVAHLSVALSQESNRKAGDMTVAIPFDQWDAGRKAAAKLGVLRVLQALHMLGYLEKP